MGAPTVGRFVVVKELGRGAMGLVLQAWDPRLSRRVAIKLPDLANAGPQGLARFEREASAAGRLRHPGIVSVLEVGEDQGRPFLVMDLIEGESFEALLRRERLPTRRAVELVLEVTRAVAHAHGQGVLHRDIKPANVLLDREGHAHLTDFGLARSGTGSDLTSTGSLMGTPECMAPEQAGDSGKKHGPASDVYALGATLYRALVGRPPLTADNLQAFFKKLFEELPPPPRALDPSIDPALDAVGRVLSCSLDGLVRLSETASGAEVDSLDLGLSGDWPVQVAFLSTRASWSRPRAASSSTSRSVVRRSYVAP